MTAADCFEANRKRVRYMQGNLHNSKFVVCEAGDFRTFLLHFMYHHNSYSFSGISQIYDAANKNKIKNAVLL